MPLTPVTPLLYYADTPPPPLRHYADISLPLIFATHIGYG